MTGIEPGADPVRIDICVCTYRRPHLEATLRSLQAQTTAGLALRIIVADNDETPSARPLVDRIAAEGAVPVTYVHAPARNISLARNACLDAATADRAADWVAFIDDDETAPPDWIATLHGHAVANGLDVVFGPALAIYPEGTPEWIREGDYHTNHAPAHDGKVETGHTCNALIRWGGGAWTGERFLLEKGRTGGEDVEFFFRLSRLGLVMGICDAAPVHEATAPDRLTYAWVRKRRFLAGQFHGAHSGPEGRAGAAHRARLVLGSGAKAIYCVLRAALSVASPAARRGWWIRRSFHTGVCAGALGIREADQY